MAKAVALISGGLDSILAAKAVKELGVEVVGLYFTSAYGLRKKKQSPTPQDLAKELSQSAGIPLFIRDLGEELLTIVKNPAHGHGRNMNPCIDCKILMLKKAKEFMVEQGAEFLITGEVVAQRPMSQHRPTLNIIEKEAGVTGILLRPLSAKLLAPTIPEQSGWVDRNKLYDFNGRSRAPQRELAVMLNVLDYPNPAGGCLLTDPLFAKRLEDLLEHGTHDRNNIELLKLGRHFRFSPQAKFLMGRDESENIDIEKLAQDGDCLLAPPEDVAGPTGLIRGEATDDFISRACGILARYCDLKGRATVEISYRRLPSTETRKLIVTPIPDSESLKYRL